MPVFERDSLAFQHGHGGTYPLCGAQKLSFSSFADDAVALRRGL
jgi:hypothetical protein